MYNVISRTSKRWIISGELTKTEYRELVHLVRRFNFRGFTLEFKDRGAGRAMACYYRSKAGSPLALCFSLGETVLFPVHTCVCLYKKATSNEERQKYITEAKETVEKYGYGFRVHAGA